MKAGNFYRILVFVCVLFLAGAFFAAGSFCLELKSGAFTDGGSIPGLYTCSGEDISPDLSWDDVPAGTKSFVLIMDDPDAPVGAWVHWVVYGIPPDSSSLEKDMPKKEVLENGIRQGRNSWGKIGYGGPCPPPGPAHRYFFKLYAIDIMLRFSKGADKRSVMRAIKGHILEEAELMGLYKR